MTDKLNRQTRHQQDLPQQILAEKIKTLMTQVEAPGSKTKQITTLRRMQINALQNQVSKLNQTNDSSFNKTPLAQYVLPTSLIEQASRYQDGNKKQSKRNQLITSIINYRKLASEQMAKIGTKLRPDERSVVQLFQEFNDELNYLPISLRPEIFDLCEIVEYNQYDRVLDAYEREADMYLILKGSALSLKTQEARKNYLVKEEIARKEMLAKDQLVQKTSFSGLATVGWILLQFVMKDQTLSSFVKNKLEIIEAEEVVRLHEESTIQNLLQAGDSFGDFFLTKGKNYKANWVIAQTQPLVCIKISNKALRELFSKQMSPENIELMKQVFIVSGTTINFKALDKISRLFVERTYTAGTVLLIENKPVNSVFLIKSGVCEVMSYKSPLRVDTSKTFQHVKGSKIDVALGLEQGSMSQNFREFHFSEITTGQWVGEDSIFSIQNTVSYTVRAKTQITVLEIGFNDFKQHLPSEYTHYLENMIVKKQAFKLRRIKEIVQASKSLHEQQQLTQFYETSLETFISNHPQASRKILRNVSVDKILKETQSKSEIVPIHLPVFDEEIQKEEFSARGGAKKQAINSSASKPQLNSVASIAFLDSVTSDVGSPYHSLSHSVELKQHNLNQNSLLAQYSYKNLSQQEKRDLAWTVLTEVALKDKLKNQIKIHPLQQWRNQTVDRFVEVNGAIEDVEDYDIAVKNRKVSYFNQQLYNQAKEYEDNQTHLFFGLSAPKLDVKSSATSQENRHDSTVIMPFAKLYKPQVISRKDREEFFKKARSKTNLQPLVEMTAEDKAEQYKKERARAVLLNEREKKKILKEMKQEQAFRSLEIEIRKDLLSYRNVPEPVRVPWLMEDEVEISGGAVVEQEAPKDTEKKIQVNKVTSSIHSMNSSSNIKPKSLAISHQLQGIQIFSLSLANKPIQNRYKKKLKMPETAKKSIEQPVNNQRQLMQTLSSIITNHDFNYKLDQGFKTNNSQAYKSVERERTQSLVEKSVELNTIYNIPRTEKSQADSIAGTQGRALSFVQGQNKYTLGRNQSDDDYSQSIQSSNRNVLPELKIISESERTVPKRRFKKIKMNEADAAKIGFNVSGEFVGKQINSAASKLSYQTTIDVNQPTRNDSLPAIRGSENSVVIMKRTENMSIDNEDEGSVWKRKKVLDSDYIKNKKALLDGHAAFKRQTESQYHRKALTIVEARGQI